MQELAPESQNLDEGLNIREYLALFWQWAWLIALATVLAGAAAFIVSRQMTPIYQAATTLLVNEAPATKTTDYTSIMASERLTRTYSEMINKEPVLNEVVAALQLPMTSDDLKEMITVTPLRDTQLIQVAVESPDPALAAAIANQTAQVFSAQIQEIQANRFAQSKSTLEAQMAEVEALVRQYTLQAAAALSPAEKDRLESKAAQYSEMYASLLQSYEQVRLSEAQTISSVVQVEQADVPAEPVRPKTLQNTLLAALVGFLLASGGVVMRESLDDSLKTPEDVARQLGLPVLGVIGHYPPETDKPISASHPRSPVAEAYRTLRTNVQFASVDRPLRTLLVTSTEPDEGKTTVAANLAVVMAQSGRDTILLDCDFRRPAVHRRFGLPNRVGLSALFHQTEPQLNGGLRSSGIERLGVMTTGHLPPNPAELLGSKRMSAILAQMKERAAMVILDTPPTLAVTDAAVLAPAADGVLLVIEPGKTRATTARLAVEQLRRVNARLLGVVLNNLDLKHAGYRYRYATYRYYPSYQGYYEEDPKAKEDKNKTPAD